MTIAEIIKRLEAGETGREIDALIFCAIVPGWVGDAAGFVAASPDWLRSRYLSAKRRRAPRYTASLESALHLVPDGWTWQVSNRAPKPHAGRAYIHNGELINDPFGGGLARNPKYRGEERTAVTPALALCIAALRAREAQP